MITPTAWRRLQHGTLLLMAFWVFPGFLACCVGNQQYTPVPSPSFDELTRVQTAPSGTGMQVGPEASVVSADGSSTAGAGVRCNCDTTTDNVAVTFGGTKYFPDAGSAYGAFVAARYTRPSDGAAKVYGLAGPVWSRSGYNVEEYEIPTGEFGGGAFQQGFGGDSQNALGVRLGAGVEFDRTGSSWKPYGEVGYDAFVAGADFTNQFRFAAGLTYQLGGER